MLYAPAIATDTDNTERAAVDTNEASNIGDNAKKTKEGLGILGVP